MKVVWKISLEIEDKQEIELPVGAKILCVNTQCRYPYLWVEVDKEQTEKEKRTIYIIRTGEDFEGGKHYIGSVKVAEGLIFHFYEDEKLD